MTILMYILEVIVAIKIEDLPILLVSGPLYPNAPSVMGASLWSASPLS